MKVILSPKKVDSVLNDKEELMLYFIKRADGRGVLLMKKGI